MSSLFVETGEAAAVIYWETLRVTWGRPVHGAAGQSARVSLEFVYIVTQISEIFGCMKCCLQSQTN